MIDVGKEVGPLLRLFEIQRWSMVEMTRPQNVAEHTFAVMVIAEILWKAIFPVAHNSGEYDLLVKWSLYHDAEEYFTTDIPSPVKRQLKATPGGERALNEMIEGYCYQALPHYLEIKRSVEGSFVEAVVKLADCMETLSYFRQYSARSEINDTVVKSYVENSFDEAIRKLISHYAYPFGPLDKDTETLIELVNDIAGNKFVPNLMRVRHGLSYYASPPKSPDGPDDDGCPF